MLDTAISVSIAWWIFVEVAAVHFGYTRPRAPVPIEGRIYPFRIVVYLTKAEYAIVGFRTYWFAVALLLFAINYRRKLRSSD
jgi:hypothetical protein